MPTSPIHTSRNKMLQPAIPESRVEIAGAFTPNPNYARGTVLGIVTATGKYSAYNDALADGTQVAKAICKYDIRVDANGRVAFTNNGAINEHGQTFPNAPVFIEGSFRTTDVVGHDPNGVADLGKIVSGVLADGMLRLT